jgi:hypothetical protein
LGRKTPQRFPEEAQLIFAFMKLSLSTAVLILAIAAGFGWQDHHRLADSRERHGKLVAEATSLGISIDRDHPAQTARAPRSQENRAGRRKLTASECIAFAKGMKEAKDKQGGSFDEAMRGRMMEFLDGLAALSAAELKTIFTAIHAASDLDDEGRDQLASFITQALINQHPQAALAFFTESSYPVIEKNRRHLSTALKRLAKDDPIAAIEWVRTHGEKFPEPVDDDTKRNLLSRVAVQDPKLAFQLIDELGFENRSWAVSEIVRAAKAPEERSATLIAFRAYLSTPEGKRASDETRPFSSFAYSAKDGFESATSWIAASHLSPKELDDLAWGLPNEVKPAETGRWIEWIGQTLPDKADITIDTMMERWTEKDYQAAGTWLTQAADGPAKQAAVASYAKNVAPYEPEIAAQWAVTLPPGRTRHIALQSVYEKWPKNDPAAKEAAEAFAEKHGIMR